MSRHGAPAPRRHRPLRSLAAAAATVAALLLGPPAGASAPQRRPARSVQMHTLAATGAWCATHGSSLAGWTGGPADLPICGPGPAYGGSWSYVDLPGPGGSLGRYYNATPGFQCVELAERYLALVDGLPPVKAEGSTVAANYHKAYPDSRLTVNGTPGAVGHAPVAGDVISFSLVPSFLDPTDGHVAVVVHSAVDPASGNGTVVIAQENVAPADYRMTLAMRAWRLYDPAEPSHAALQYPYAAWFHLLTSPARLAAERSAHRPLVGAGAPSWVSTLLKVHPARRSQEGPVAPSSRRRASS